MSELEVSDDALKSQCSRIPHNASNARMGAAQTHAPAVPVLLQVLHYEQRRRGTHERQGQVQGRSTCRHGLRGHRHQQRGTSQHFLIFFKRATGVVECAMVPQRGAALFPTEVIETALKAWGLSRVVLSSDQEPAMVALGTVVQAHREGTTMLSYGPEYGSKSRGQGRKRESERCGLDDNVGASAARSRLRAASTGWPVTRCGSSHQLIFRSSCKTAFRHVRGKETGGSTAEICETALRKKHG